MRTNSVVLLGLLWGCGAAPLAAPLSEPTASSTSTATSTPTATATSTSPSPQALPPAKPTTIPLTSGSDSPIDRALAAGDLAFEQGDLAAAAKQYEAAKALGAGAAGPLVGLARVRIARTGLPLDYAAAKGNAEVASAVKDLRRAAQIAPSFGAALVELGRALLLVGDAEGAIGTLRKGLALLPEQAEAHSVLGVALLATGHRDEALAELAKAAS